MSSRRILVTGGAGFLGPFLCDLAEARPRGALHHQLFHWIAEQHHASARQSKTRPPRRRKWYERPVRGRYNRTWSSIVTHAGTVRTLSEWTDRTARWIPHHIGRYRMRRNGSLCAAGGGPAHPNGRVPSRRALLLASGHPARAGGAGPFAGDRMMGIARHLLWIDATPRHRSRGGS